MRFKYSLAYPIIIIISLVAAATLFIGYYLNLHSLQDTIEAREKNRSAPSRKKLAMKSKS